MSNELDPIVAGIGYRDGANRGFWRIQPRQKIGKEKGQWIEMGAELRAYYKDARGKVASVSGRAVGSDGTPDVVRVLVQGQGIPDGIYPFNTKHVRVADAIISDEYLKSQGIDPATVVPSDIDVADLPSLSNLERADVTPDDVRLANEGIDSPEGQQMSQFKESPEGKQIETSEDTPIARAEKPRGYGTRDWQVFKDLPDGTVLDEYDRAQFYPNSDNYDGPFGPPATRSIIKQDGKWYYTGKDGKASGKPLDRNKINDLLRGGWLTDQNAASKIDENGKQVPAWADEVAPSDSTPAPTRVNQAKGPSTVEPVEEIGSEFDPYLGQASAIRNSIAKASGSSDKQLDFSKREYAEMLVWHDMKQKEADQAKGTSDEARAQAYADAVDPGKLPAGLKWNPSSSFPNDKITTGKETDGYSLLGWERPEISSDRAIKNAWNDAMNGGTPDLDAVINAAKGPDKGKTKKLLDLNKGDKIVTNKGEVLAIDTWSDNGDGTSTLKFTKADGTKGSARVKNGQTFTMADKNAKPAAPSTPSTPAAKNATKTQIDQIDNFADQVANDPNIDPAVKKSYDDLVAKLDAGEDVTSDEAKNVLDQVKAHYGKKVTPKAAPTVVPPKKATPTAAPKPIPEITKKSASELALAKKRTDKGGDVALDTQGRTEDQLRDLELKTPLLDINGKPVRDPNDPKKIIQDPNAIVNAILEQFPNAVVDPSNDRIILERGDWTDKETGKEYTFEMGISRTYGNQFVQHYKFTDKATGEVKDLQLGDYKDSFAGIFSKSNGLLKMRDQILGEALPGKKMTRELRNYFGPGKGLDQRLKYYRKGKDLFGWKFLTPEENVKKFLEGTDRRFNLSMVQTGIGPDGEPRYQFGNVLRGQVTPFWDAMESKDFEAMKWRLTQLLGRMPDSPQSRQLLVDTLRRETTARFKGMQGAKGYHTYANLLDIYMKSNKVDLRNINRTPFVYGDGSTVANLGDKVIYFPNEREHSVGTLVGFNAGSGKNGQYHDTVRVQFADGTTVDLLQTRNMFPAGPNSEFGDPELTDYTPNAKLDTKLALRQALLGPALDEFMRRRAGKPAETNKPIGPQVDPNAANPDAGQPYLGSDGQDLGSDGTPTTDSNVPDPVINSGDETTDGNAPSTPVDGNVVQLQPNDSWYGIDGSYLGVVVETVEVPASDGGAPGLAVYYIDEDGNEQVEVVEKSDNRGPK